MGISKMTKEHLAIALTLELPVFVVFTKIDLAPINILQENLKIIAKIIKENCAKIPILMKENTDIEKITD